MDRIILITSAVVCLCIMIGLSEAKPGKKVILHVPMNIKSMKHTHTVIKTMHRHHYLPKAKKRDQEEDYQDHDEDQEDEDDRRIEQEDEDNEEQAGDYGGGDGEDSYSNYHQHLDPGHYWKASPAEEVHTYNDYYEE